MSTLVNPSVNVRSEPNKDTVLDKRNVFFASVTIYLYLVDMLNIENLLQGGRKGCILSDNLVTLQKENHKKI